MERCSNCHRELTAEAYQLGYCEFCGFHIAGHPQPVLPLTPSPDVDAQTATTDGAPTLLPGTQRQKRLAATIGLFREWSWRRNHSAPQSRVAKPETTPHEMPVPFGEHDDRPLHSASLANAAMTIDGGRNKGFATWGQRQQRQAYIILAAFLAVIAIIVSITSLLATKINRAGSVAGALAPLGTATALATSLPGTGVGQLAPTNTTTTFVTTPTHVTGASGQPTVSPPVVATTPSPKPAPTWHAVFQEAGPDCNNPSGVSWNHLHGNNSNVISCSGGRLLIQQGQTYYPEDDLLTFPGGYDPKQFQAKVHVHFQSVNSSTYVGTDATLVVQAPAQGSTQCGGYYWEIRPNGNWRLQSLSSGCAYSIVNSGWVGAAADYNMEVQVQSGTLRGYINGSQVISIADSLKSGVVGLSVINWAWPTAQVYYSACEIDAWK